jgi:hypothetical protein
MVIGSVPAYNIGFSLPSGLTIDTSKLGGQGADDVFVPSRIIRAINSVVFNEAGSNSMGLCFRNSKADGKTSLYAGSSFYATGGDCIAGQNYNGCYSTSDALEFYATSIPIQGWNANFNPLLSMPLVDLGSPSETWYAKWQSSFWDGTGDQFTWDFSLLKLLSSGGGTIGDSSLLTVADQTSGTNTVTSIKAKQDCVVSAMIYGNVSNTATIEMYNSSDDYILRGSLNGANGIENIGQTVHLKAGDYIYFRFTGVYSNQDGGVTITAQKVQSGNMAHIIKPSVAILSDEKAYNVPGGDNTTGSWLKRIINTVRGESWFVTGSFDGIGGTNTTFTLESGTYKIQSSFGFYRTGQTQMVLYDETNSSYPAFGIVSQNQTSWSTSGAVNIFMKGTFTITASTEFSIKYRSPDAYTNGLGLNNSHDSTVNACYGQVMIEKLK